MVWESDSQMISRQINLSIKKIISANIVSLDVTLDGETKTYNVKVVNNNGLFGFEFPADLGLILQNYPSESKALVGELRIFWHEQQSQAA